MGSPAFDHFPDRRPRHSARPGAGSRAAPRPRGCAPSRKATAECRASTWNPTSRAVASRCGTLGRQRMRRADCVARDPDQEPSRLGYRRAPAGPRHLIPPVLAAHPAALSPHDPVSVQDVPGLRWRSVTSSVTEVRGGPVHHLPGQRKCPPMFPVGLIGRPALGIATAVVDGSRAVVDGSRAVVDGSRAVVDGSRAVVDGSRAVVDGSRAVVDGGRAVVDGSRAVVDGSRAVVDGGRAVVDVAAPSSMVAAPSSMVAAPSSMVAAPSSMVAAPSSMVAAPSSMTRLPGSVRAPV